MTALSVLWFFLLFILIAGYFVLDGFDLGIGVLTPFVSKDEYDRALMRRSIGPVWDGNEVWLLTAGGALFAAFPDAYATTFSGFYLAIMLVLFGLIVRAISFEFAAHDAGWRKLWEGCFFVGSLLPAILLGVAVGNVYAGIPMDMNGDYAGIPLLGLITPFTLLCGLLGFAMFLAAGACWGSLKLPLDSPMQVRMRNLRLPFQVAVAVLFVAVSAYALLAIQPEMAGELAIGRIVFAALFVICLAASIVFGTKADGDLKAFLAQSGATIALVLLLACSMFPVLVNAAADSIGPAITIFNAAASELSLFCMTIIVCIGLPLVLIYHVVIYRTFRGRLKEEDTVH